ncbi:MAG: efflux RND transporter periplasmic adaptor subunit [Proteobacteria bacterium]|nr:efflux RND transporter periplasmic adaptor subunit [Desulfocapsa sp.]MBU3944462.1 efflux RND transporter periplasmic adaptor subunit [Pseudomonadota bacterium]MCG2744722.1 efflux RND transporter periplasmic adaptor subunit [Desulfobacteraceae bacterium]MBU3984704.1 efflux RND transporter periplasmic adaptor subunit [Pseudomonadota bacterium]MBU4029693.1 efflux RND transporter periplasmic adaptor subunit [Pseudomonadota bacterium]
MFRHRIIWIILFVLLGFGTLLWYRLSPEKIEVIVAPVEQGAVEKVVANTRAGTLKACRQAHLSPAIGGQLSVLAVQKGDQVQQGQLLLELWNKDLLAEKELAASEARTAQAQAESARVQAENSSREAKRLQHLFQIDAIAEETMDKAKSLAEAQRYTYQAALAAAETSLARLNVITTQLERTRLLAPFPGIIAEIHGELNEYITPSPPGIATLPAIELLDTSSFYITAPIDEVDAAKVLVGAKARVTMDAFGDRHFAARVRRIAPYVLDLEKQARTVEVELEFTDPQDTKNLLAGYSVDAEIILEERSNTLRIPTQALLPGNRVYVYQPQKGRLEERIIQPGLSNWDRTEVIEGLQLGELIVLSIDQPGLKDGITVRVSQEESTKK